MRLTRETLLKIARDTASQRARVSRRIICIYLTGSVLGESPLLGGTTDIDLVIIHDSEPLQPREMVKLSDEVHLDISHYDQALFHQPRHLRSDPWLGPFIYAKPLVLYDTQHWFDFTQASTGAQFFQPDYILQRATVLSQAARQTWMELEMNGQETHAGRMVGFLSVLENAGNSLVCLTDEGQPLTERRFMVNLPLRLQSLNQPELLSGLTSLLVKDLSQLEKAWPDWMPAWKEAYQEASHQEDVLPRLQPFRQLYYQRAMEALWEEHPSAALWLMMRTWSLAASRLPEGSPALAGWQAACQVIGLDEASFPARMQELDHYLDRVEEALEGWANANGVSSTPES